MCERAEVTIRLARTDERLLLEDLQRRASLAVADYRSQLEAHSDAIALSIEMIERKQVLVAEVGSQISGFAVVVIGDEQAELDGVFVKPEHWRQGIGTALVGAAIHAARRNGAALMVIASPASRGFYESCGFSVEDEVQTRFGPALRMSR